MILGVAGIALIARVVLLDIRISHFDEARVAYGTLRYLKTGAWSYDPSVHGPFLFHVNKTLFGILGPNDFTARLIVALIGGCLPLTAWLFREHLRPSELGALAVIFAADPVLLYYSRFMRNDLLVATFMIAGLGLFVRLLNTSKTRYLYAGTAIVALAFTAKENAIIYPVTILGGLVLLVDHRLFLTQVQGHDWAKYIRDWLRHVATTGWRYKLPLLIASLEFVLIFAFFYAPRLGPVGGLGLWESLANPSTLPDVFEVATLGTIDQIEAVWFGGSFQDHAYWPYLGYLVYRFAVFSWPIAIFAVIGFFVDRYSRDRPNDLIALGFYGGVVSLIGYPVAMSVPAAWTLTHVFVFLAFPAAGGIAFLYRWIRERDVDRHKISAILVLLLFLIAGGFTIATDVQTSYISSQRTDMAQYAQPEGDMRPAIAAAQNASRQNTGLDVLWFGRHYYVEDESGADRLGVPDGDWYDRLPVPWYLEIPNATIHSVPDHDSDEDLFENPPPVIITCRNTVDCPGGVARTELADRLEGYVQFPPYESRYLPDGGAPEFVFFVDESYVTDGDLS